MVKRQHEKQLLRKFTTASSVSNFAGESTLALVITQKGSLGQLDVFFKGTRV